MEVNTPAAYGMYSNAVVLRELVRTLNQSGFEKEDICVMVSPEHPIAAVLREANILNAGREATAVTTGVMGWLMKLGAVVIPNVGFFIRSQTFLRALVMRRDSRALCENSKALVGLGFSEGDAERCESQIRDLGVLIYIACQEQAKTAHAVEVMRSTGAYETAALENAVEAAVA
jgi:hypothetical protein